MSPWSSSFRRRLTLAALGAAAVVVAGCSGYATPATNVTQNSATLHATVSCDGTAGQNPPSGSACVVWFKYWPHGHPDNAIETRKKDPVTQRVTNLPISQDVGGLTANTTYDFQVCGYGDTNVPPPGQCGGILGQAAVPEMFRTGVAPATDEDALWTNYASQGSNREVLPDGKHWTGGDNSNSVKLPDGRIAWVFADATLDPLRADGQANCLPAARTALVMDSRIAPRALGPTYAGADGASVGDLIPAPASGESYLPTGMTVETNPAGARELRILVVRAENGKVNRLGFGVARFSLPANAAPHFIEVAPRGGGSPKIYWGNGILDWLDGYTYVYGSGDASGERRSYVARVPNGDVLGTWQFWDGSTWTTQEANARPLANSEGAAIPAQAAATPLYKAGRFVMFSVNGDSWGFFNDPNGAPPGQIQAWTSPTTWGPWTGPINIYSPPEKQSGPTLIYGVAIHPEISGTDPILLSYNVWSCFETSPFKEYRPRFIRVPLP